MTMAMFITVPLWVALAALSGLILVVSVVVIAVVRVANRHDREPAGFPVVPPAAARPPTTGSNGQ